MRKITTVAFLLLFFSLLGAVVAHSQTQINPKIGFETWTIKDEMDLSNQSSHSGQTIGFDVYILHNRLLFAPGFYYHRMSILNQEEGFNFNMTGSNGVHYFSIPLTVGLQVIDMPVIDAFVTAGGESTFFYSLDKNDIALDDDMMHGVFASLTGGAQVELFSLLTVDVKYHYALHPILKSRPESKLRGWTLAAGIKF
ncbi:MAG TPA: hypothetical protein VMZ69_11215 [Saprospiraceae bacterium]|nr:hypothetical protein [Saprospiraceae bacterium]